MNLAESIRLHQNYGKSKEMPVLASVNKCSGCSACYAVCPAEAICMSENKVNGFLYPEINSEICIRCGKCSAICRDINEANKSSYYSKVYAAINKDNEARFRAASGAMFEAFSKSMLENNGAVAGAIFTEGNKAEHIVIEAIEELPELCGTKYFQSDIRRVYKEIEEVIKTKNKKVLFCGTPCQVKALKVYAKEMGIEEKLFTIDLICRGIPSPKVWEKYLEYLENKHRKTIQSIKVKDKEKGWDNIGVMITFKDGSRAYEKWLESVFERSFIQTNYSIRESCFSCNHKSIHRQGDITIGDFWGLKNTHLLDGNMGTSILTINSDKGRLLFDQVKGELDYIESTMWRVFRGNMPAFTQVYCDESERALFWDMLNNGKNLKEAVDAAFNMKL